MEDRISDLEERLQKLEKNSIISNKKTKCDGYRGPRDISYFNTYTEWFYNIIVILGVFMVVYKTAKDGYLW